MRLIVLAVAAMLTGCATSGTQISDSQMAAIQKGTTTHAEVVARLGKPMVETTLGDGSTVAIYSFSKSSINGATFIPVVGMFAGGMKVDGSTATFTFGPDGVLKDVTTSTSHIDTHNGATPTPQH